MSQKNEVEFFVTIDGHYCIVLDVNSNTI